MDMRSTRSFRSNRKAITAAGHGGERAHDVSDASGDANRSSLIYSCRSASSDKLTLDACGLVSFTYQTKGRTPR